MQPKNLSGPLLVAAGSRDGDRLAHMGAAVRGLAARGVATLRLSSLYETEPVGLAGARPLLNGVIEAAPGILPRELLRICLEVEASLGRRRARVPSGGPDQGPRPLDLDVLLYGGCILDEPGLVIPHPRLQERRFVLVPLAEIAPHLRHPLLGEDMATLLARCPDPAWVRPFSGPRQWSEAAS